MDADKEKKPMENMANWADYGVGGYEDLTAMFRKLYGLDWMPEVKDMPNYFDTWTLTMKDYAKPFHCLLYTSDAADDYLTVLMWVGGG